MEGMKKRNILLAVSLLLLSLLRFDMLSLHEANAAPRLSGDAVYDLPLCQPGYYQEDPGDCMPAGPSESIKALAEQGFPYPLRGLAAHVPDASLSELPERVAMLGEGSTPYYASFNDAVSGGAAIGHISGGGGKYVSVTDIAYSNGRNFVRMKNGGWIEATPHWGWPKWQGLEFFSTPKHNFGFTIDNIQSFTAPSFASPSSGISYTKYDSFPIYNYAEAEGYKWYEVAPGEWIPSLKSREVLVNTHRPDGVDRDRWIAIDLENQTLAVYENSELKFATVIASGAGELYSDPGVYEVYHKIELHTMQGSYAADRSDFFYYESVPWALYYNHAQAIHGIYWPAVLGFPQSHGCINMFPGDANWLFHWTELGEYVYVFDPSGQTPMPTPTPMGTPPQPIFTPTPNLGG
jgi:hypothetical protein